MKITPERALELAEYSDKLANQAKKWNEMIAKCPGASHVPATPGHDEIAAILRWAAEVMKAQPVAYDHSLYDGDAGFTQHVLGRGDSPVFGCEHEVIYPLIIKPEPPEV